MKFFASLGHGLGNWLGVPSPESLGLPSNIREIVAAQKSAMTTTAIAAPLNSPASVASLPTSGGLKAGVEKMGATLPRRADSFGAAMAGATIEDLAEEFGFLEKFNAAPSTVEKAKIRGDFQNYAQAYRVKDFARMADLLKTSASGSVKPAVDSFIAKAVTSAPATDDNGTPVRTPVPDDDDDEPTMADILPAAIKSLEELIQVLKDQMPDGSTEGDDAAQAKATAALRGGSYAEALNITAGRLQAISEKQKVSQLRGRDLVAASFRAQLAKAPKTPDFVPHFDLPADPHNVRPSAAINDKYRTALAALDTEISACVAKGRPLSQQLLARRNTVNREWLAINRRKN